MGFTYPNHPTRHVDQWAIPSRRRDAGTSSIVHETTHQPLLSTLSAIVETVVRLRAAGHKVVLVSSGAIGVGLQRMSMPSRPKSLSRKQASPFYSFGLLIVNLVLGIGRNRTRQINCAVGQSVRSAGPAHCPSASYPRGYLRRASFLTEIMA